MQYLSSFFGLAGPSATNPNVFLYDSREQSDFSVLTDMAKANTLARTARAVLGFNGFLNPIRGRKSNNYHFTCLKYIHPSSSALNNDTDIVQQDSSRGLSGNASIAQAQSYSIMNTGGSTTVFLTTGMIGGQTITMPPIQLHDGNCPYGQYATGYIAVRYVRATGETAASTPSAGGSTGACKFITVYATETPNFGYAMMGFPTSLTANGANGQPGIAGSPLYTGVFAQNQAGVDESPVLDKAFFYSPQIRAFCKLDTTDFDAIVSDPGTRPKMKFKQSKLFI
ncbi:hypothetical protein MPK71_gp200 [Erwinia phage pEa_SNUABM_1]|uniref:Uncharacterized protein n=1 Tax=Erwinia phage pEa_SNUABM_1 TaxID=2869543 RepID=A0AAE7XLX3_9CAUD|nr:hypothetical protein MPK71_gp200 [Erwinia phage pEa_SNUABM_1]QZE57409.1 hypothetical protein pEaSNUABM1_00200 [Erwinia phage pEa_SNUABM_1]